MPNLAVSLAMLPSTSSGLAFYHDPRYPPFEDDKLTYPLPARALSASDGQAETVRLGESSYAIEGHGSRECHLSAQGTMHGSALQDGHDFRSQTIATRVGALEISSPPSRASFANHHALGFYGNDTNKIRTDQGWAQPVASQQHGSNAFLRLTGFDDDSQNGMSGSLAPVFEPSQVQNPMWGLGEHRVCGVLGEQSAMFHGAEHHGHEGSTATGSSSFSSLASSHSFPDPTWSSTDPWLSRHGLAWLQEDHEDRTRLGQENGMVATERASLGTYQSASATSIAGDSANITSGRQDARVRRDVPSLAEAGGSTSGERVVGNRVEEGSIGSKRRIWYRAPNGQFASATQTLSGSSTNQGNGNGDGRPRGGDGIRRIRRRRKSEEVERKYRCDFEGCDKAYGTLNRK